jgi:hypothetical protein
MVPLVSGTASTAPVVPADSTATTPAPASGSSAEKPPATRSGRFLTAKERLPKGLPDWFSEKDADHDGQVGMSEYAGRWSPETVAEFAQYDLNHDGIITAAECLKAEKLKAGK